MEEDKKIESEEQTPQKKKKLTKEQKKQLKKAQAEALKLNLAKQELQRDLANIRKLTAETKNQWKKLGLKIAGSDIKDSMQTVWKQFEYTMDKKDWLISELLENLEAAEEQSRKQFEDNFGQVNKLINIFGKDVSDLQLEYREALINFLEMRNVSLEDTEMKENNAADYLKTILHCLKKRKEEQQYVISGDCIAKREEEENKNTSEIEALATNSVNTMETIWNEYRYLIEKYNESTASLQMKLLESKERADANEIIIKNEMIKTEQLTEEVEKLKERLKKGGISKDKMVNLEHLRQERNSLSATLWTVKTRFREKCKIIQQRLKTLVTQSNKEINTLILINEKAEKILTLNRLCSKLETKNERNKYYSWPSRTISQNKSYFFELWRFWQLVGHAEMVRKCLAAEKQTLTNENVELEDALKNVIKALEEPYDSVDSK